METQGEGDVLRREGMEALQWDFRSSGGGKRKAEGLELWDIGNGGRRGGGGGDHSAMVKQARPHRRKRGGNRDPSSER